MKHLTKKVAIEQINEIKQNETTAYFDGSLTANQMKEMLRYRMGFGEAETNVIIAALVISGAKFQVD